MCGAPVDCSVMATTMTTSFRAACAGDRSAPPGGTRLFGLRAMAVVVLVAGLQAVCAAAPCPTPDVWVASTRRLPGICRVPERVGLDVERLAGGDCGRWERASVEALLDDPGRPLVVFIHGNRYAAGEAKGQGLRLARLIAAGRPDAGAVRTLIFSWPSEQEGVLLRDVRVKYDRAHADGHYLAWLLGRVDPDRPVAVVGYSYGAIVGLEALRDRAVADGPAWADRPGRTHLVLVAPAVRCDALAPRGPYRATLAGLDRLTIVANSDDSVLTFFHVVDRDLRAGALGAAAMPRRWLPADVDYAAVDAADIVGHRHRLPLYLDSPTLARRITTGAVAGFGGPAVAE